LVAASSAVAVSEAAAKIIAAAEAASFDRSFMVMLQW
jgi:hypothetical protein